MAGFRTYLSKAYFWNYSGKGKPLFAGLIMVAALFTTVQGQISPGDLHRAHAFLEGVDNCVKCHSPKGDQLSDKCLVCHNAIADQRKIGKGLHAGKENAECFLCHVEHQGRDFDLIYFRGGQSAFDHGQTGFRLDGKHTGLECRQCHTPQFIQDPVIREAKNLSLERTFLGLDSSCIDCHFDEHREQLSDNCQFCHNTSAWRPAAGFDHADAAFTLQGKHLTVQCAKCHAAETDVQSSDDAEFNRYKPIAFAQCSNCHADVHKGRLGHDCESCHTLDGWKNVKTTQFNHDQTRFPLRGKHITVTCKQCHGQRSTTEPLKFAACMDCHSDFHKGAFADRTGHGACEECHTVEGFRPSNFLFDQHAATDFPLQGAHLAVPCQSCHFVSTSTGNDQYKFVFTSLSCLVCHKDPHREQVDKFVSVDGCQYCHSEQSWRAIKFNHDSTDFPLDGKHAAVPCRGCHAGKDRFDVASIVFTPLQQNCRFCHSDPHHGQFTQSDNSGDCAACHNSLSWKNLDFDHDIDTRFALEGAHRRIACNKCHKVESDETGSFTRYHPLDIRCESCHGTKPVKQESG